MEYVRNIALGRIRYLLNIILILCLGGGAPVLASTTTIDPNLVTALSAVNTAPTIIQHGVSNTTDSFGQNNLDVLKIIQPMDPLSPYKYLGVYHRQNGSNPTKVGLVGSNDLADWTIINDTLDGDFSSQPDITKLSDNSYLVIYENNPAGYAIPGGGNPNFRIRHYASYTQLVGGSADRQFDFENTLSSTHCAEGTPNFRKITYNGNLNDSVIEIGFHYCNFDASGAISATTGVPDSTARGTLTNFRLWRSEDFTALNRSMRQLGVVQVGQMSTVQYQGNTYTLVEGQMVFNDFGTFKLFIYNEDSNYLEQLNVTSPGGSYSIANPRLSIHYDNSGNADGVIGSYAMLYASSSGCFIGGVNHCPGTGEGGTFLFRQNLSGSLIDGSQNFTPFSFVYNPVFAICSNGCLGVLLANQDMNINPSITNTDIGGVSTWAGAGQQHMIYGPYWTSLPALPLSAIFKMQIDYIGNPNQMVAIIEAVDATLGTVIASKQIYRRDFRYTYAYMDLMLPFDWSGRSGHQVEFRVWSNNVSYIKVASVGVYLRSYTFFCPGQLIPSTGAYSTGTSCISNSASTSGNIVYGPYYSDFPGVQSAATFSLRAPYLGASGSTPVASIDVHAWNPSGQDAILASATIRANQLDGNYRTFALTFDPTYYIANGWKIETRVNSFGNSIIENQWSFVTPQP